MDGEWRMADGSDVPASFNYNWYGLVDTGDFMASNCIDGRLFKFGDLDTLKFICQHQ